MGRFKIRHIPHITTSGQSNDLGRQEPGQASGSHPLANANIKVALVDYKTGITPGTGQDEILNNLEFVRHESLNVELLKNAMSPQGKLGATTTYGAVVSMGNLLYQHFGRPVYFSIASRSGTGIYEHLPLGHPNRSGELHDILLNLNTTASLNMLAGKGLPESAGFYWWQGENNAGSTTVGNAYASLLSAITDSWRASHRILNDSVVVVTQLYAPSLTSQDAYNTIRSQIDSYVAARPYAYKIEVDDLVFQSDDLHLQDQETHGQRRFDIAKLYRVL